MKSRPTIILLTTGAERPGAPLPAAAGEGVGASTERRLEATIAGALESGLPVIVVASPERAPRVADWLAWRDIVIVSDGETRMGSGRAIAAGVAERSGGAGWLVLPEEPAPIKPETWRAVAAALDDHPVAVAQHRGRRGHPIGFGAELYSELMRLAGDDGVRRLVARYPAVGVEVDDPGVLVDGAERGAPAVVAPVRAAAPSGARLRRTAS